MAFSLCADDLNIALSLLILSRNENCSSSMVFMINGFKLAKKLFRDPVPFVWRGLLQGHFSTKWCFILLYAFLFIWKFQFCWVFRRRPPPNLFKFFEDFNKYKIKTYFKYFLFAFPSFPKVFSLKINFKEVTVFFFKYGEKLSVQKKNAWREVSY